MASVVVNDNAPATRWQRSCSKRFTTWRANSQSTCNDAFDMPSYPRDSGPWLTNSTERKRARKGPFYLTCRFGYLPDR